MSRILSDLVGFPINKVLTAMTLATLDRPLTHLDSLEAESIHIFREVAAEFERPVLLFSGGKDSVVMLHLAAQGVLAVRRCRSP